VLLLLANFGKEGKPEDPMGLWIATGAL
jgi:hypothetical protein